MASVSKTDPPFPLSLSRIFVLAKNELRKNITAFLMPAPFLAIIWLYRIMHGAKPLHPAAAGAWIYFTALFFIALVYGLLCFSAEADRKTLDFLLTRPLPPFLIAAVKYGLTLFVLLAWLFLSRLLVQISPAAMGFPQEMGFEWVVFILVTVHAMSCFAGLLAKGLERLLVIVALSGVLAGVSYHLWWRLFNLMQANFYLPDAPPSLTYLIDSVMPLVFGLLSLWVPFTGTWWILKNRAKLWRFTPALWGLGAWLVVFFVIVGCELVFAPVLWPLKTAKYGDWHPKAGIVTAAPVAAAYEFRRIAKNARVAAVLSLSAPGGKAQPLYHGFNLRSPRFSPDGQWLLFMEKEQLKLMRLQDRTVKTIGRGTAANWSQDARTLIFARKPAPDGLTTLAVYHVNTGRVSEITRQRWSVSDLAWDDRRHKAYIFSSHAAIYAVNLKTQKSVRLRLDSKANQILYDFGIFPPALVVNDSARLLFMGQVIGREFYLYTINLKNDTLSLMEDKTDFRIKSGAPLIIHRDGTFLLWPRVDGGFEFQSTYYNFALHDTD